uniref:Amine oxidase n=1 Tax=Reishia bronni TaxID=578817 RepID=A0A6G9KP95_9CAEN|nr:capsule gland specific secretory protein [Reishia bronni]
MKRCLPPPHFVTLSLFLLAFHFKEIHTGKKIRCPPEGGGLVTSGDPALPGPFHDVTRDELSRVYNFLRQRGDLNLGLQREATVADSSIFCVDLFLPTKQKVLEFLDRGGPQPKREAYVMIFRGDKAEPVVEEYRVGPLDDPHYAELIVNSKRRNPVPFAVRPVGSLELQALNLYLLPLVDRQVGFILQESYGARFSNCSRECLGLSLTPKSTVFLGRISRRVWFTVTYSAEFFLVYPLDFGILVNLDSSDPRQWTVEQVWYSNVFYSSLSQLADRYVNDPSIPKTVRPLVPADQPQPFSTIRQRGGPYPQTPQRPPVQLDLDGKRYSIEHRHLTYQQWSFHVRMSALRGPQVYDVRYMGHRIAYEIGLSEIAVFYSGDGPFKLTDYVDGGVLIGIFAKGLVEGADCPKGATFLSATFLGEGTDEPVTFDRSLCVFEHNTGVPLYRHMSYRQSQGGFYAGMMDSVLIVRTILTIINYDYIIDFIFRQDGSLETRVVPTGYIVATQPLDVPDIHGWRLGQYVHGNFHHHMFHFKADLDIAGTCNRYETLNFFNERVVLEQDGKTEYNQIRFERDVKKTERAAVFKFNFDAPTTHIVYNQQHKTEFDVPRSYKILLEGMSKQLLAEDEGNERTISWARQQLAVTVRKEEEMVAGSSSPYAFFDSLDPVVNFTDFIGQESIVDQDLVFWMTLGTYHLPHTEDLPVTPTGGGHLSFFLIPHNFYPENPALSSRDLIRVERKKDRLSLVQATLDNKNRFCDRTNLKQLIKANPDAVLETVREIRFG